MLCFAKIVVVLFAVGAIFLAVEILYGQHK